MRPDPNSLAKARDRMLTKLNAKMTNAVGHRGDMFIADFKQVDPDAGHLLIGYEKSIGPILSNDVIAFVSRIFEGTLRPMLETAKQHRAEGAVQLMVTRAVPTRRYDDRGGMLAVSSTLFLDQQMGDTWEVRAQEDGTKYLARIAGDDISSIVNERRRRMTVQASVMTFGHAMSAGVPNLNKGDQVRFYDGGRLMEGRVLRVGDEIVISAASGSHTVAPEAVVEVLQVSPETEAEIKGYLNEYFKDAYGFEGYAGELTDRLA